MVAADRREMPIIFVTEHAEVATVVEAMKGGASEFFTKPIHDDLLVSAVAEAIEQSRAALPLGEKTRLLRQRYLSLSVRERQVLTLVVAGLLNKQIGGELEISEITVKAHRGHMMRKMQVRSVPDLVRMAVDLDLEGYRAVPRLRAVRTEASVSPRPLHLQVANAFR